MTQCPAITDLARMAQAGEIHLIDVRELSELQSSGKAQGARHIALALLPLKATEIATDRPVAIYCAAGGRAGRAADLLRQMGHETVWNIGGLADWVAAGGPVEQV
ncbi:rhodanese-like domain-containing protein [Neogemmobacter tilapiae]|uniref:Sulfurtransferase n=1 Tax=Neogemmobacter tilapiae TaxID=875041 RepID=A0A918TI57_9RHOB|nr:rhodanese-like domain-containing protein [Gemmobacter tilapiae]GHC43281.1 sulfurtransferase [Gemmobacter tilapiae]